MTVDRDVAVIGGGISGLAFACALRTLARGLDTAVIDAPAQRPADPRWSAISAAGRRLFQAVGAWDAIAPEAEPIHRMVVGAAEVSDPVKPAELVFAGEVAPGEPFGHMVPNAVLVPALRERAVALGAALVAARITDLEVLAGNARLHREGGPPLEARLVAAADGGRSLVRRLAGFKTIAWTYDQVAFVVTVRTEKPHAGAAVQVFLPDGPIAALPIRGEHFSIVWTVREETGRRAMEAAPGDLAEMLNERLGWEFGAFTVEGPRELYPLRLEIARDLVRPRVALLGDAAHVIHPLAGQALNLGFKDAAILAEVVADAAGLGLDPGSEATLADYERRRRFDTVAMATATDGLNRLFSTRNSIVRGLMGYGLALVDRLGPLKDRIVREAAGIEGDLPLLLRRPLQTRAAQRADAALG